MRCSTRSDRTSRSGSIHRTAVAVAVAVAVALALVLALTLARPAHAATTALIRQPFCTTSQGLHDDLLALVERNDGRSIEIEGCAVLKGGLEIVQRGKAIGGMHVDWVTTVGPDVSLTGWTLNLD